MIDAELAIIAQILQEGIENKQVQPHIVPQHMAYFILSSVEGSFALGKSKNSLPIFHASMQVLIDFLQTLKF